MPVVLPNEVPADSPPTGASTPNSRQSPSRRETILSLVEMLLQQGEDTTQTGGVGNNQQPSFEDDRDVPTVDEHLQVVGADDFNRFQRRINNLDKELRNFANAARQLGSSVAILSSAFHLRERLAQILFLYRENAADLFPRKITHITRETITDVRVTGRRRRDPKPAKYKTPPHVARPTVTENLDPERFPEQLEALAKDVTTFLNCLNEFPEFTDEAVNASILSFSGDLKYWASCLQEYSGQFRYPAVQKYIHDLTTEMGEHIDSITVTLSMFIEVGVPTIRFAQQHGAANLLNLSTVATFFSAVTATTLQFSYALDRNAVSDSVNCFWFASMVFSIGAAVNSLLGLTWKQAMYRSPGHRVPWWVLIWIKRSPLVFLVMSVACFSVGLCCFAYASQQAFVTSTITTVLTAFTSFGLAAVSAWFASERWIFLRHRGKKWLSDVLLETKERFLHLPGMDACQRFWRFLRRQLRYTWRSLRFITMRGQHFSNQSDASESTDDLEATLPRAYAGSSSPHHPEAPPLRRGQSSTAATPIIPDSRMSSLPGTPVDLDSSVPESPNGKKLWIKAVRTVRMQSVMSSPMSGAAREPLRRRTTSSSFTGVGSHVERKKMTWEEPFKAVLRSRVAALVPKLKVLEATQDLAAHQALVRHLQFSPDGKFLATSSWDRTSVIFRVGDPFISHRTLAHAQGFVGQVAWSPTGNLLLTKLSRGIKVWTAEDGVCKKTIDRQTSVESITWFPNGQAFISVEGSMVTKLDLNGKLLDQYDFGRMRLHDVAVTPDSVRLLGVGPLLESPSGLQPSKCKAEKRLVVYNMDTKMIENQTPVLNDVRDITLAQNYRNGLIALISYENKAPPQLWKLDLVRDRENTSLMVARLILRHTYMPRVPVDFAGPSYFGGRNHELVLCAGKAGDIHIWDQESGALLHHVRAQALGGDLTCIAWNHAADNPFMFATGSHDGAVRIWTKPDDGVEDTPTENLGGGQGSVFGQGNFQQSPVTAHSGQLQMQQQSGYGQTYGQTYGQPFGSSSPNVGNSTNTPSPHIFGQYSHYGGHSAYGHAHSASVGTMNSVGSMSSGVTSSSYPGSSFNGGSNTHVFPTPQQHMGGMFSTLVGVVTSANAAASASGGGTSVASTSAATSRPNAAFGSGPSASNATFGNMFGDERPERSESPFSTRGVEYEGSVQSFESLSANTHSQQSQHVVTIGMAEAVTSAAAATASTTAEEAEEVEERREGEREEGVEPPRMSLVDRVIAFATPRLGHVPGEG